MKSRPFRGKHKPVPQRSALQSPVVKPQLKTDWGDVADWYDQLVGDAGSEYQREVVFPGVTRLLDGKEGQTLLDVACGQGVLCRLLHEKGLKPTGVDAATALIQHARERSDPSITFIDADATQLLSHPSIGAEAFDAATCILAIQNINPLGPVFAGVARALKPRGRLVIAMMHPCFRGPKETHWGWDEEKSSQYRRVDRYLLPRKEPITTHPGKDPGVYTWTFHRPIESYIEALRGAGLFVDAIEEWPSHKTSDSGPRAQAENIARREIPLFMAIRAVKN